MTQFQAVHCESDLGAQPLHCHEEVEFAAVYRGRGILQSGRVRHAAGQGILSVVCPQEAHTGVPLTDDCAVKVLHVSAEWFAAMHLDWRSLRHKEAARESEPLLSRFFTAYEAVRQNQSRLIQEEALLALWKAAGRPQDHTAEAPRGPERVTVAVHLVRERFAEELSLAMLADSVGLTPSYFCRAFQKAVGLPPHAYQNSLRVARAKTLLETGKAAGEVAVEVGFYDQSHLLRHFKRLLGVTPADISRKAISSYHSSPPKQ